MLLISGCKSLKIDSWAIMSKNVVRWLSSEYGIYPYTTASKHNGISHRYQWEQSISGLLGGIFLFYSNFNRISC